MTGNNPPVAVFEENGDNPVSVSAKTTLCFFNMRSCVMVVSPIKAVPGWFNAVCPDWRCGFLCVRCAGRGLLFDHVDD